MEAFKTQAEIKEELIRQLNEKSDGDIQVSGEVNLLPLGINSINIMKILSFWIKEGYQISFSELIRNPYIDKWSEIIFTSGKKLTELKKKEIADMYQPFPLTDVQYAYWIGRRESQFLGGVGCHGYFEVDCTGLNLEQLSKAWNMLFEYHPMLRARYLEDGTQVIMKEPYNSSICIQDLKDCTDPEGEKELRQIRERLSHRLLNIEAGEVVALQVSIIAEDRYRLHFEIDLLVCDVQSFQIILRDFAAYYRSGEVPAIEKEWNFAQYLQDDKKDKTEKVIQDEQYWKQKINVLPDGPQLPQAVSNQSGYKSRFQRHLFVLKREQIEVLEQRSEQYHVTLAMVLLTAYGMAISNWTENKRFLMNITLFNRNMASDIENVVADFTNLLLVGMDFSESTSFLEHLNNVNNEFLENMDHTAYSGVKVLRDIKKKKEIKANAPVVFSCNLGNPLVNPEFQKSFGDIGYMITQTPQVLIDLQVFSQNDNILLIWDALDDLFPGGLVDEMFGCFTKGVERLADKAVPWDSIQVLGARSQEKRLAQASNFATAIEKEMDLTSEIFRKAEENPSAIAIINPETELILTYQTLAEQARYITGALQNKGIKSGDRVAVWLPRGETFIVSVLGILSCGAVYIPVSNKQPEERIKSILKFSAAQFIITDNLGSDGLKENKEIIWMEYEDCTKMEMKGETVPVSGQDSAYIIFTSGSTGVPKGVEITHQAAMNTIATINQQYQVDSSDRVIGVSASDFDLSVYDIFGMLNQGGSLVVISDPIYRDARRWVEIIKKYKVTIWNSVPTLMKMLMLEANALQEALDTVRLVLLSGDWIDLDIPEKLQRIAPDSQLIAMGGATEAAIWSNYYEVNDKIPADWKSIPYGTSLKNQIYRVVDKHGNDCPDYVSGELWIGGLGVAKGYVGDRELTDKKFVMDLNQRWYRTGDLGRFWSDGTIEFLGRMDNQVKVRGHRIELGEIENAIKAYRGIEDTITWITEGKENKQILAAVSLADDWNLLLQQKLVREEKTFPGEQIVRDLRIDVYAGAADDKQMFQAAETIRTIALREILESLKQHRELEILPEYQPIVAGWKAIAEKQSKLEVSSIDDKWLFLDAFVQPFTENILEIISGEINPNHLLLEDNFISPNVITNQMPNGIYIRDMILKILTAAANRAFEDNRKQPLKVLEVGSRDLRNTMQFYRSAPNIEYTILDKTQFFIQKAKKELSGLPNVKYCVEDLDNQSDDAKTGSCFDIILLNNTLHQYADVHKILQKLQQQLTAGGLLIFTEMIKELPLQDFTGVFLKADVRDERAVSKKMLFTREEWKKILFGTDMKRIDVFQDSEIDKENFYQELFVLSNQREKEKEQLFEEQSLKTYLLKRLPEYMVPSHIAAVPSIPLTENGKMDRKKLMNDFQEAFHQEEVLEEDAEELTGTEKRLKQLWDDLLHVHTNKNSNYFKMGGDSLLATALAGNIRKEFEIDFSLEIIFQYPILSEMASHIAKADQKDGIIETELPEMIMDSANRYQPFPLTDVQQAYWIGRTDVFNYSQVSTQCYFEMDCDGIDLAAVERSWNLLIAAHDMLRAVILKNGEEQQVIEKADYYHLKNYDLTSVSEAKKDTKLMEVRAEMSIRKYDMHSWPLFDIRTAQYEEDKTRLFISFDNIVLDGFSMFYLFREWKYYYLRPSARIAASDITFRDYVINYEKLKATDAYKKDLIYWENRAREMYPAPELNIKADQLKQARRFERFSERINRTIWSDLKEQLKSYGITPAAFLIGAYAEVIGLWSKNARFSINLTRFNRLKLHEEVDRLIGDFTSLTILGVDTSKGDTFLDRIQAIQNQLWEDLNHPLVSGVVVERLMNQMNGNGAMPVVFTSGLGLEQGMNGQPAGYLGKIHYGLSQTPQVWLDYQVYEEDGELSLSWDALIDIFPEGMVAEMFYAYTGMIHGIHRESRLWEVKTVASTKAPNEELRKALNNTDGEVSEETLIGLFEKAVKQYGEKYLIESDERSLSYGEVDQLANGMAELLQRNKIGKGDIVAIQMKKGWEQIIAVIAILKLGAVYLPLNINNPIQRNAEILESSGAKLLLINEEDGEYQETYVDKLTVLPFAKHQNNKAYCVPVQAEDLAYIIYTSGTTGRPKGVAITHQGAVNTILDVNYRISADHSDKAMVISDISFDLSVYDMFGMMACGGSIVIPDFEKAKEPAHWKALLEQYHVTIWNSVPMFMQMFLSYLQYHPLHGSHSLKYTLLSGDWIPLTIKEEMDKYLNNCKIYGLGGATEASIWSNIFLIEGIDSQWKSIPYGKPLANQRYYIFNEVMQDCPNHVIGDLYIGGLGLAREYWRDQEATRKSFIRHPDTRERLYKTGDLALYRPDGNIEFCGREDDQVKVNGFRIELGEINHYIQQNPSVKQAESIVYQNEIYAVIVADEECIKERIIADLEQVLPEYMIPKKVISVDWIALTANGKVDKKRLYGFIQKELRPNNCVAEALTEREKELKDIWIKIMQCEMLMAEESFLQAGGTSLMAVQIINALNKRYGIELSIKDFYQNATVRQLAQFVEAQLSESELGDI